MEYSDFFEITDDHPDVITNDDLVSEAMRKDITFDNIHETVRHLKTTKAILIDEVIICYKFLKEHDLLQAYHKYRDGE